MEKKKNVSVYIGIKCDVNNFQNKIMSKSFLHIIRLIPLMPFDIINYKAGLSKIKSNEKICNSGKLEKRKMK